MHRTRVQHLREDGDLFAYRDGRINRYPLWQFTDRGRRLPGLRRVLATLGPVHHSVVVGFMTFAQPELETGTGPVSARDWLAAGKDPEFHSVETSEVLWRIHRTTGSHVMSWNEFRTFRADQHLPVRPPPRRPAKAPWRWRALRRQ